MRGEGRGEVACVVTRNVELLNGKLGTLVETAPAATLGMLREAKAIKLTLRPRVQVEDAWTGLEDDEPVTFLDSKLLE